MEPAASIIKRLGGHRAVADALGIALNRVYYFTYSKEKGGTGGTIPQKHWDALFEYAREKRIRLTANDLLRKKAA